MAAADRAAWARDRENVHIYGNAWDGAGAQARVVWTPLKRTRARSQTKLRRTEEISFG
jgi:hypothetical protein